MSTAPPVKIFATGEVLRDLPHHEAGDIVSGGLGRWVIEDTPVLVVQDVPVATVVAEEPPPPAPPALEPIDPKVLRGMRLAELQSLAAERGLPVPEGATRRTLIAALEVAGANGMTSDELSSALAEQAFVGEE